MPNIGTITKKYRQKNSLSLGEFAKRCDLSKTYVFSLENGNADGKSPSPTLKSLVQIANAMDMSTAELLVQMGVIEKGSLLTEAPEEMKPSKKGEVASIVAPFPYIAPVMDNVKAALPEGRFILLPFRAPKVGGEVYIPIFEGDGMVVLNTVTAVYGGVYEASSELLGSVNFTLFDIDRDVYMSRGKAYDVLNQWRNNGKSYRASKFHTSKERVEL